MFVFSKFLLIEPFKLFLVLHCNLLLFGRYYSLLSILLSEFLAKASNIERIITQLWFHRRFDFFF